MIKKKDDVIRKILFSFLFFLLVSIQACSPSAGLDQAVEVRATWTPVVQPTDQPYQNDTDALSYFKGIPVLVILGSQNEADDTPLKVQNLSTEDVYDVSSIPPASFSTWSRPIVAENKDVYFQVGGTLYILSSGGQTRSIELPYDPQSPAYCNWSWKDQLVCLNDPMTTGFLVDQDLNVVEMELPADEGNGSEVYYEPYRVGENGMRAVRTMTKTVNGRETVFYKDLNLETLTIQSQRIRIDHDFNRHFLWTDDGNELNAVEYTQEGGNLDVLGVTDNGEKIHLCSSVTYVKSRITMTRLWMETYDTSTLELTHNELEVNPAVTKKFYRNHLITDMLLDEENNTFEEAAVFDLESGKMLEGFLEYRYLYFAFNVIFPYEEGWLFGTSYDLEYHRRNGDLMDTYYFTVDIYESVGSDGYYTITQPIEP